MPDLVPGTVPGTSTAVRTICLYDQQLILPLLHADLARFRPGVRIVLVNDSCLCTLDGSEHGHGTDVRALPATTATGLYRKHQLAYDAWQAEARAAARGATPNPAIVLEACHEEQRAREDALHGRFTSALLTVWNGGRYLQQPDPTYRDLLERAAEVLGDPTQTPRLSIPVSDNPRRYTDAPPFVLEG